MTQPGDSQRSNQEQASGTVDYLGATSQGNAAQPNGSGNMTSRPHASLDDLASTDIRGQIRPDPLHRKLARRAITMPLLVVFTTLWWGLMPVVLPVLLVTDLVRRVPLHWTRFYLAIAFILFGQTWGMFALFGCWLFSGFGIAWQLNNRWSFACQGVWGNWVVRWVHRIFGIALTVEGAECFHNGPTILLMRHTSINDTILPISMLCGVERVRLRIVLKAELLFAPIVDAIGHRFPVAFIKRSSHNPDSEFAAIRHCATAMHSEESVMIFPEGTRFTAAKRQAVIDKAQAKDPMLAQRATELTHVLPLRLGGTNALIEAAPEADLVIGAHTGYEDSGQLEDFINGGLCRSHVKVKFWRIKASDVPTNLDERAAFLHQEWRKVNDWVAANQRASN